MTDLLALSAFDAVMAVVAAGSLAVAVWLIFAVRRLRRLERASEIIEASLTDPEIDRIQRFAREILEARQSGVSERKPS